MWQQLLDMFQKTDRSVEIYDGAQDRGLKEINELGASPDSVFGAIIINTCGIVFDKWVYVLGQTSERYGVLNFAEAMNYDSAGLLVVARDIVGGLFALNMGRFAEDRGMVWYFAPDTLEWESLEMKYSEFIAWLVQGKLSDFYSSMRWSDWRKDAESVSFDTGILIYPYLWAKECNIETASKRVVPLAEIISMNEEFARKL
jgi:hypothetical protein